MGVKIEMAYGGKWEVKRASDDKVLADFSNVRGCMRYADAWHYKVFSPVCDVQTEDEIIRNGMAMIGGND